MVPLVIVCDQTHLISLPGSSLQQHSYSGAVAKQDVLALSCHVPCSYAWQGLKLELPGKPDIPSRD